jgi:hypothetical protein
MAAPVLKVIDTPSYILNMEFFLEPFAVKAKIKKSSYR